MRLTRDRIAHNYRRAKRFAGQAWNTTERVLSVADRAAGLAVKGMTHLGHRVEPEHRVKIGKGLVKYFETRQKMEDVKDNVQRVGTAFRDAGFTF